MQFIHSNSSYKDTIAAIATPPGEGGIAIVRLSGPQACKVADTFFSGSIASFESHKAYLGTICSRSGDKIDQALAIVFRTPRSFTGEDVVEFHCHGGSYIARKVLERAIEEGARPARPGEFALKAFMNGKIDLSQAEAIQDLIGAKSEQALKAAEEQLEGKLSKKVQAMQQSLVHVAAILEAWVDFPEEDLEFAPFEEVIEQLEAVHKEIELLISTYEEGRRLREGIQVSLVGAPNVGKSSLMNALIGSDRSIVSPIAGTTRDVVHEDLKFSGINMRLVDTAGIRQTEESIEEEGIRRSKKAIGQSDVILLVLDSTRPSDIESHALLETLPKAKTVAIWNKSDLQFLDPLPDIGIDRAVHLSALQNQGIDGLRSAIEDLIWEKGAPLQQEVTITNLRHKNAFAEAAHSIKLAVDGLKSAKSAEFIAFDVRSGLVSLGTIIGTNITEDILDKVFSSFCIGK